jgi:hypothetical protein
MMPADESDSDSDLQSKTIAGIAARCEGPDHLNCVKGSRFVLLQ